MVDLFTWLHDFNFNEATFHVASALGLAPSVAWQTTLSDFIGLSDFWEKVPPIHLVVASFVKKDDKASPPKRQQSKPQSPQVEQNMQDLDSMGVRVVSNESIPGSKAFHEALDKAGGDPTQMQEFFEASRKRARRAEAAAIRKAEREREETKAALAAGRPRW